MSGRGPPPGYPAGGGIVTLPPSATGRGGSGWGEQRSRAAPPPPDWAPPTNWQSQYGAVPGLSMPPGSAQSLVAVFGKGGPGETRTLDRNQKILLYIVPCLFSLVLYVLFANVYHRAWHVVLTLAVSAFITLIVVAYLRSDIPFHFWLAAFSLFAVCTTTLVGVLSYHMVLSEYWLLYDSNTYTNILPSEPASGYADAGKLVFADGTRVDATKALGYKDGDTYCVAPIVDDLEPALVEFWAVGRNCCGARGSFECDDAWDRKARSGVVAFGGREKYSAAMRMAEAAYGIASAETPVLVHWVVEPEQIETKSWRIGISIMLVGLLIQQLLFAAIALGLNSALQANMFFR